MRGRGSAPGARTGRRAGRLGHFHFAVRRRQFRYVFLGSGRSDAGSEQRISGERCRTKQLMAVLSYFSLLVLLPILCAKDSKYARFHANQGLMLLLVSMGWQFISAMLNLVFDRYWWQFRFLLSLSGVGYLLNLVLFCMGVANAVTGKAKELPLIGHFRILH